MSESRRTTKSRKLELHLDEEYGHADVTGSAAAPPQLGSLRLQSEVSWLTAREVANRLHEPGEVTT